MCVPRPWQLSWSLEIPADISEESLPCSRAEQVHAEFCPSTKFRLEFFLVSIKTYYPLGLLLTRLPHQSLFPSWINNLSIDFRISWYLGSTALLAPGNSGSAAVGIPQCSSPGFISGLPLPPSAAGFGVYVSNSFRDGTSAEGNSLDWLSQK